MATVPKETNIPGIDFHRLTGNRAGTYTIHVNGPWYITFRWDGLDVNLENYHWKADSMTRRHADRQPSHPGAILRDDVLPALQLRTAAGARTLGVSRQMFHRVLSEPAAVTPEMAVRIGKLCGNGPRIWMAMQQAHALWQAERDLADQLPLIRTLHAA